MFIGFCSNLYNLHVIIDIFCFYIAFFFFKAGICFQPKSIQSIVKSGFRRLIIPYIFFSIIGVLCVILCKTLTIEWMDIITSCKIHVKDAVFDTLKYGAPQANLPLWFLLTLFMCRILMNIMVLNFGNKMLFVSLIIIIVIMQVVDCIDSFDDIPLYFKNIPLGLSLMFIGYLAGKNIKQKYILACLVIYILLLIIYPSHLSVFGGMPYSGIWITGFIALVTGCASIKGIASSRLVTCNRTLSKVMEYLGKHSMSYYCIHWVILLSICYIPIGNNTQLRIRLVCMIISCIVLLPIFDRLVNCGKLKWIVGEYE